MLHIHPTTEQARVNRKHASPAEAILWRELRGKNLANYKFHRQFVIGPHITDFCCRLRKLVIEVGNDETWDGELTNRGYRVLRLTDVAVLKDLPATRTIILAALEDQLEKQIADLDARYVEM